MTLRAYFARSWLIALSQPGRPSVKDDTATLLDLLFQITVPSAATLSNRHPFIYAD